MTSLEGVLSASKTEPAGKAAVAGKVVLVMQGGGAQAAYEGGVYEALHEAGIEPDWVIGTSIGGHEGGRPKMPRARAALVSDSNAPFKLSEGAQARTSRWERCAAFGAR
jgi:Patatin-like phospholipase